MMQQSNNQRRRGTTIVELLIAALIMTTVFGAIGMTVLTGSKSYEQGIAKAEVDGQARRLVGLVANEFLNASRLSCLPGLAPFSGAVQDDGFIQYDYRQMVGAAGGNAQLSPITRRVRLAYATGEIDDGIDNNANGLIDECRVMLTLDTAAGPEIAIGGFVREYLQGEGPSDVDDNGNGLIDERGLCMLIDPTTNTMMVRLTIERLTSQGRLITSTAETAVRIRND